MDAAADAGAASSPFCSSHPGWGWVHLFKRKVSSHPATANPSHTPLQHPRKQTEEQRQVHEMSAGDTSGFLHDRQQRKVRDGGQACPRGACC